MARCRVWCGVARLPYWAFGVSVDWIACRWYAPSVEVTLGRWQAWLDWREA